MAIAITMKQAFDQALEEITNFHLDPQHDGFPRWQLGWLCLDVRDAV
jgi:hypothetical protein